MKAKVQLYTLLCSIFIFTSSIIYSQTCTQCDNISNPQGAYASEIGQNTTADGECSFAGGVNSLADGGYSFAFGNSANALGHHCISLGLATTADGGGSIAIGKFCTANGNSAFTIGQGFDNSQKLTNTFDHSLMIGFNSDRPTLFIGESVGVGKTGKIGIGDVTSPLAKLHIKADDGYTTEVLVQWSNNNMANLWLGTTSYGLKASTNKLEFKIPTGGKYVFNDGNLGIGTATPTQKLEVSGNIKASGTGYMMTSKVQAIDNKGLSLYGTSGSGIMVMNDGKVGIGTNTPTERFEVNGNIKQTAGLSIFSSIIKAPDVNGLKLFNNSNNGIVILNNGNVGIGVSNPGENLDVAGYVHASGFKGNGSMITNVTDYRWESNFSGSIATNASVILGVNNYTGTDQDEITTTDPQFEVRSVWEDNRKSANFVDSDGRRIFFVPKIYNGYNSIASLNDAGIFWSDSQEPNSNQNEFAGFVIGPHRDGLAKGIKIDKDGNVGIGKAVPTAMLDVAGKIMCGEVEVISITDWKDCVFENSYKLMSLGEIESFINKNKHLPEIPSEKEVLENGINLGEMNALLLQKIEELTLYVIALEKEVNKLKTE